MDREKFTLRAAFPIDNLFEEAFRSERRARGKYFHNIAFHSDLQAHMGGRCREPVFRLHGIKLAAGLSAADIVCHVGASRD